MPPTSARSALPSSRLALGLVAALLALLGISLALRSAPASAASGPVADYSFDAGSGTTVEDRTGHGHTATIEEGTWARGRYGGAISFTGSGKKCVTTPDAADLRLSKAFTIEAWVRPVGGVFGDPVVVKESEGKTAYGLGLGSTTEGMAEGFIGEGKSAKKAVATDEAREYAWTNIATTYDGSTLRVYVDGELSGTKSTATAAATGSGELKIGCDTPEGQFTGRIDEVRIYNRTLPEKEVRRDMVTPLQSPPAGPVADYSFDTNEGETAADGTGHGHTATVEGATWTEKGKYGGAYEFDAAEEDVIKIPDSSPLDFTEEFTLEAWVRPSGAENRDAPLIDKQAGGGLGYFLYEGGSVSDRPKGAAEEEQEIVVAEEPLDAHAWSHVALTFDGDRTRLYVDGELVDNGAAEPIPVTEGDLEIGGSTSTGDWFDGKIDEVRVYDRALSKAEVQADSATPIQTPKTGPLAEYTFDEGEGETASDVSGHGHDATIGGAERSEGKYGGSLKFGGEAEDMLTIPASEELNLTEEFTLEAWVKPEAEAEFGHLFVKENAAGTKAAYLITKHGSQLGAYLEEPEVEDFTPNESMRLGVWQHVAVTYDGARLRMYLDGHLEASEPVSGILSTDGPLRIGGSHIWGTGEGFVGKIDQVKVYGRALDQAEVDADKSPRQGPVAAYTFNENEGTAAGDISGDGHTAAVEGAEWTEGKYGRALQFSGEDKVSVPASEELDLTDEFTLEAWIRPEASSEYGDLFVKENGAENKSAYVITDHKGRLGAYLGSPEVKYQSKEGTLPTNTWTYVAVTDSGYHVRLYINGELVETGAAPEIIGTDGKLRIGGSSVRGPGDDFTGKIDEPRVYDRSLSEAQIESDMHNDFTPPEIELSGALTEGLKEGTTEYPLHVHAIDGKAGFPGVGVKSITISVDGTVVKTVEQECEAGSCAMETDWTYAAPVGEREAEVVVTAIDQSGNADSSLLSLVEPDGSIPACSPNGGLTTGTPNEVVSLPGGGELEIYEGADGTVWEFPEPPAGFEPLKATNAELEEYAFEPRPTEGPALKHWEESMSTFKSVPKGSGCVSAEFLPPGPGGENGRTARIDEAGFVAEKPESGGKGRWRAAKVQFKQPAVNPGACTPPPPAAASSWVGIGRAKHGFFQAGTLSRGRGEPKPFVEKFFSSEENLASERVRILPFKKPIEPKDRVEASVRWDEANERAVMMVKDLETGEMKGARSHKNSSTLYFGEQVEFMVERPARSKGKKRLPSDQLAKFGQYEISEAEMETPGGVWQPVGAATPFFHVNMRLVTEKEGVVSIGPYLASTSLLGKDEASWSVHWKSCNGS
ncbi:MAG TPA: LamG domain-containing protein [Solirubrobacterales bacterium]|nr:LamG domain-containing protein [Solirubrobacterales bacterium]